MKKISTPKKALVTGGAGFIGSHLCKELLERGVGVSALDNLTTSRRDNLEPLLNKGHDIRFYEGSILDRPLMEELISSSDVVYHFAAAVGVKYILDHPLDSMLTNIEGTENILELASKYGKKVVIASSSEVYGKQPPSPIREENDRILGPTSISRWSYSDSKAIDEFLAFAYGKEKDLPVVIVRLFNVVGPGQRGDYGMVVPRLVQEALANQPITVYGDGKQARSFIHVEDAVRAIIDLSFKDEAVGHVFNVGGGEPISMMDLAAKIKERTASPSPLTLIPYDQAYQGHGKDFEDVRCRIPDITKIREMINFEPRYDIEDVIDDTIEAFTGKG